MTDAERNAAHASTIHRPALRYHPLSGSQPPKKDPGTSVVQTSVCALWKASRCAIGWNGSRSNRRQLFSRRSRALRHDPRI